MTKKDYELIAGALHEWTTKKWLTRDDELILENISLVFAKRLQEANPRFNKNKFMKAVYKED